MPSSGDVWAVRADGTAKGRGKFLALVVGAVVLVVVLTGGIVHFTESGAHPVAIRTAAEANSKLYAAAVASGSFHYVNVDSSVVGGQTETATQHGDAGRNQGVQYSASPEGNFEVIVVGSMAYMKADAKALGNVFGLPPAEAAPYINRWISFKPSDAPYKGIAADVTSETTWDDPSSSFTDELPETPVAVSGLFTLNGASVQSVTYSLHGSSTTGDASYTGTETAIFSATDPHVPAVVTEHLSGTANQQTSTSATRVSFSQWGESVNVQAPVGSIPYSSFPQPTTTA